MSAGEQFSLVWNTFPRNLSSGLYSLLTGEQLVDVTLAAEGQILRAHKLILSVCSTYFRDLFKGNTCKHPIVILKDVNYRDLSAMLHFMYQGEVSIKQEDIASFLKVAEILKIKGLTKTSDDDDEGEKDLVDALPLIQHDRGSSGAPTMQPAAHTGDQQFSEQPASKPGWPCQCAARPTSEEVSVVRSTFREPLEAARPAEPAVPPLGPDDGADVDVDNDEPLDCSVEEQPKPEYKPEPVSLAADARRLTPELECVQRLPAGQLAPLCEQENVEGMLNTQLMGYSAPHCQGEPVGFHDTGTGTTCAPTGDFSHEASTSCNAAASKGRRTVKGLPGSSLSLETTLRVISELGPTIRMERGKVIRMYSCPWCLRHFTRKENLKLHVRYIHGPLESLTCKLCGNKYKNSNSLRVHSYLYHNAQRNNKSSPASSTSSTSASGGNKPPILGGNA